MRRLLFSVVLTVFLALGLITHPGQAITPTPDKPVGGEITGEARFFGHVTMPEGVAVPEGLEVVLEGYDMDTGLVWNGRAAVQADGSFEFPAVPVSDERIFAGFVVYGGVDFLADQGALGMNSEAVQPGDEVELTFTLYETTTDASILQATRLHVILEPSTAGKMQVSLWYVINNPTGRVVVSQDGQPVTLFSIPQGASGLQFQEMMDTARLIPTENGFGDTSSVQPGSDHQMFYTVQMSYQDQAEFILPLHLPVGQAIIMLPEGSLDISGEGLIDNGVRTTTDGSELQVYTTAPLEDESTLRFRFGNPQQVSTVLVGGLAVGAAALAAGFWWLAAGRKQRVAAKKVPPQSEGLEDVLDSIVALDELYHTGELGDEAYQQRRAELKARARMLKEQNDNS